MAAMRTPTGSKATSITSRGTSLSAAAAYTNARTSGNICHGAVAVDPTPNCTGMLDNGTPNDPSDDRSTVIVVPSGSRLPITPKFKASATARYTWPMWTGHTHIQGAIAYQGSAPSDVISEPNRVDRQDARRPPWWTCSSATIGAGSVPNCSPRTSSTTATNCLDLSCAVSVPRRRSSRAAHARLA